MNQLTAYLQDKLPDMVSFGIKILLSLLIFYIGTKVIKWLMKLFRTSLGKANIDTGVVQFVGSIVRLLLYAVLIFNIAARFGVTEASVAALLGSAGITIGLALQGGLANLAGGVMILLFKPFVVGDYIIEHGSNCEGTVEKIEMCYTTLSSIDNKRIVIPNGTLSNNSITNVTARDKRRLEMKVGISYRADLKEAKKILERLLKEEPGILSEDEMVVFVDELGASAVILGFRAWVETDKYWTVKWRMNEEIKEAFDAAGIGIPYPQMDIHYGPLP
ncbi:MAG: mechanosensitive ion channel family protein [Blautia sp.]|jgi:small conductance mechanosensitive channel